MGKDAKVNRTVQIKSMLSPDELAVLDARRGRFCRGTYLRLAAIDQLPPVVPELNRQAWRTLSRAAGNLSTLATDMRAGQFIESSKIRAELSEFRTALISLKGTFLSSDGEAEQ